MYRTMLKSTIHRATVTQADLHYVGSVTVDEDLMDAADLIAVEQVAVVHADNHVLATGQDPAEALPRTGLLRGDVTRRAAPAARTGSYDDDPARVE